MELLIRTRRAAAASLALAGVLLLGAATPSAGQEVAPGEEQFICDNDGANLSAVDVLETTGEHGVFLDYLREYDAEGYAMLDDPVAADKTVWAPTDAAFAALGDAQSSASPEEIKAILGYHISPPRRTADGDYPIVTFDFLADGGQIVHQTRTGILTESDQRVRTKVEDGVYTVQDVAIQPVAWCTQAGSVFAIDEVITDVRTPGWFERTVGLAIYYAFFQFPLVTLIVFLGVVGALVWWIVRTVRRSRRSAPTQPHISDAGDV